MRQVIHALLTRPPLSQSNSIQKLPLIASFDLHVLGTPPAFILSQDQTLVKSVCIGQESLLAILSLFTVLVCFQTVLKNFSLLRIFLGLLSIVQLSRFFLCSVSSDSFYILSKALSFVKNFFNFFHFLFCGAFSQRVSSSIIPFRFIFVNCFLQFFQTFSTCFFQASRYYITCFLTRLCRIP